MFDASQCRPCAISRIAVGVSASHSTLACIVVSLWRAAVSMNCPLS
jgi:hypothetical protein